MFVTTLFLFGAGFFYVVGVLFEGNDVNRPDLHSFIAMGVRPFFSALML
jgi:hypothetical protein